MAQRLVHLRSVWEVWNVRAVGVTVVWMERETQDPPRPPGMSRRLLLEPQQDGAEREHCQIVDGALLVASGQAANCFSLLIVLSTTLRAR